MSTKLIVLFTLLLLTQTLSHSRPTRPQSVSDQLKKHSKGNNNKNDKGAGGYFGPGRGLLPGTGFGLLGFTGKNWGNIGGGYGGRYGGPTGGYNKGGVMSQKVVCKEKGHRYMEKLRCPTECFKYFSRPAGRYKRVGGCTIDCRKKCGAYC